MFFVLPASSLRCLIWLPFQPPAWDVPATDPAEPQQPAPSTESSGMAREFTPDSNQEPWSWQTCQGNRSRGVSYISGWAGMHFNPLERVMGIPLSFGGLS